MHFYGQIQRIERIDFLIRSRSTGTPSELAQRLQISPSQLYQTMKLMKERMKAPIYYSKAEQRYCYHESVEFICAFKEIERKKKEI